MPSAFAALLIAASTLQAPSPGAPPRPQPATPSDGSTVTVTGCLAKGTEANSFLLTNVHWPSSTTPGQPTAAHHDQRPPAATPPTTGAPSAAKETADEALKKAAEKPAGETLRLAGAATQLKLAERVGHTITATGMVMASDPVVSPAIVLPDKPPAPATPQGPPLRVLNVRSVTDVSAGCK